MEFHNKDVPGVFLFSGKKIIKQINRHSTGLALLVVLFLTGLLVPVCSAELTTQDVLISISDKGTGPNLAKTANAAAALSKSVGQFCKDQNSNTLEQARTAWKTAYLAWRHAEPFMYGPSARLEKKINVWPAATVVLDAAVKDSKLGHMLNTADTRGFSGLEYLLYAKGSETAAKARCSHMLAITREIVTDTKELKTQWETKTDEFKRAGDGNPFLLPEDALSLMVARVLNVTEVLLRDRIAVVSNFFEKPSRPDNLEAWLSRSSVLSLEATVKGIRQAIVGDGSTGLTTLVATKDGLYESKDPKLARDIKKQLGKIEKTLSKLNKIQDLHARIKDKPGTLKKLYKQLNTLQEQLVEAALVLELDVRSGIEIQLTE